MTTNNNTKEKEQHRQQNHGFVVFFIFNILFNKYFEIYSFLLYTKYFYCKRFCSCSMLLLFIVYQIFLLQTVL